jgi:hypothetical protein
MIKIKAWMLAGVGVVLIGVYGCSAKETTTAKGEKPHFTKGPGVPPEVLARVNQNLPKTATEPAPKKP